MKEKHAMRYLGGLTGSGVLKRRGTSVANAEYELDGYSHRPDGVRISGEIELAPDALKDVFGRPDVQLVTEGGQVFALTFSDKELRADARIAHVEITGELSAFESARRHQ